jgi:predicted DNA-binding protein (MmcQ/YjbR family)
MNIEEIRDFCLAKPGVTEGFPFGQDVLVFKVTNKMFALTGLEKDPPYVNLKCDPERAIELREEYEDIRLGWHMNKVIMEWFYAVKSYSKEIDNSILLETQSRSTDFHYERPCEGDGKQILRGKILFQARW